MFLGTPWVARMAKIVIQLRTTTMRATSDMRRTVQVSEDSAASVLATNKFYTLRSSSRNFSARLIGS